MMPTAVELRPDDDTFEVTFRNTETGTEATTRITAPSIGEAGPLAKTKIRSLPGLPDHVLWVIRNYDKLDIQRVDRKPIPRVKRPA
jgi:hypothetical protein